MTLPFPEPTQPAGSRAEVLLRYLDYFRAVLIAKLDGLGEKELRSSILPSGWAPLELAKHLTYVELRWLEWGFEGADVAEPWGDSLDGRWHVRAEEAADDVLAALRRRGQVTADIVGRHDLEDTGVPGPRWDGEPPATLERCLLHLIQEYARHVGHLDIVRELADGRTGES